MPVEWAAKSTQTLQRHLFGSPPDQAVSEDSDLTTTYSSLMGIQNTESENHPNWRSRSGVAFRGDTGGDFFTQRKHCVTKVTDVYLEGKKNFGPGEFIGSYRGPILPTSPTRMAYPSPIFSSHHDLDEMGTTAIARCSPTNPAADVTVFVGEVLHEGLPRLNSSKLRTLRSQSNKQRRKSLADEYLNYQFGWRPFVSDLSSISKSIINSDAILDQYERDSGKMIRRRYDFPPEEVTTRTVVDEGRGPWTGPASTIIFSNENLSQAQVIQTDRTYRHVWFSGAFSYYVPMGNDVRSRMARQVIEAKRLGGVRLTPDAIWNLAPWSWAIDWFTNAGDVLKNVSAWITDSQVLLYGYVMEHTISERTYSFEGPTGFQTQGPRPPDVTLVTETKVRRKATPYGFGLTWDGFSHVQQAILVALGITRSH